jgi:hypothetical protein
MNWADKEPWPPKLERLLARIDELNKEGKPVGLIGVSAGASAVINAYAARKDKIVGVVAIAGKMNHPEAIGSRYAQRNPSFVTSARDCEQALRTLTPANRKHILSRFALLDGIVPRRDSVISGARNRFSPTIGHVFTIVCQITFGAPSFLRFLKHQRS